VTVPSTPEAPKKLTALHYHHLAAGAQMVDDDGWQRPERYGAVEEEVAATRSRVGLADISPVGKLDVKLATNDERRTTNESMASRANLGYNSGELSALVVGRWSFIDLPGGRASRVRCCQLGADHRLVLTAPEDVREASQGLGASQSQELLERAYATDVTSVLAGLALVGPRSREVLRKLTALDVSPAAFPDGAVAETGVAGVHAVLLRGDLGGAPAYELYVTRDVAEFVWDAILDAGREYDIALLGMLAYRSLGG
jgi:sarcosine oxidase, subunit alpha